MNWRPISTLNRTETQFVLVTDCDVVRLRLWNPFQSCWEDRPPHMGRIPYNDLPDPTHWMPLPDLPPAPKSEEDELD